MSAYSENRGVGGFVIFILFLIGSVLTLGLYLVKTRAQTAKAEAAFLAQKVQVQEEANRVLRAELAYLESPARLSELSHTVWFGGPVDLEQIIEISDIEQLFPLRQTSEASP